VIVEGQIADEWQRGLIDRGHEVHVTAPFDGSFGHAHAIVVEPGGMLAGAADPRARVGSVAGL
jgi:gamma-glutamyltranspeptidase / glutathione hydrolase